MSKKPDYRHDVFHMPMSGIPSVDTSERVGIAPKTKSNKRVYNCEECHAHNCTDCEYACSDKQG